jgi:flagellar basal-body rod protein FlgB
VAEIPVLSQLGSFLSLANQRETVIASNMANIDTPGYRTKDFDFQHELARALASSTNSEPQVAVHNVKGLLERPDGNNVDIDQQALELSEAQLQYQMGTQLMKDRFHQLLTAINSSDQ